jgi:hypothetical protein
LRATLAGLPKAEQTYPLTMDKPFEDGAAEIELTVRDKYRIARNYVSRAGGSDNL